MQRFNGDSLRDHLQTTPNWREQCEIYHRSALDRAKGTQSKFSRLICDRPVPGKGSAVGVDLDSSAGEIQIGLSWGKHL